MMKNKRILSSIMVAMFTMFIVLSGTPAGATPKKISAKTQLSIATKYIVAAEKYVKPAAFTVKWAQISVYSAKAQIKLVTSKNTRNILTKRLNKVQLRINARAKELADIKNATLKVVALENAAKLNLTVAVNLIAAEALIKPITVEVAKLTAGTTKKALQNRILIVKTKVTKARIAFNAAAQATQETHNVTTLSAVVLTAQGLYAGATEGTADGNYTVGSKATLQAAITTAQAIVTNAAVTSQATIDMAVTTLNAAITAFNAGQVITHDVTTLSAVVLTAQGLYAGATEGTADGNYAVGSKATLQTAITTAQAIVTNAAVTSQAAIDMAVTTLNAAITAFNAGQVVTHDVTTLSAVVLTAQGLYAGATEGTADGNYAVGSKATLQTAITTAQAIVTNAAVTSQAAIDMAVTTLNAAITAFNAGQVVTHDVTTLSAVVLTAQGLYAGATEGTADGNYAVGSKATLQTAITTAQAIVTNAAVTSQAAIDMAVTTLNAAITAFNAGKVVTHDVTALSAAIITAQGLYDGATEGTAVGNYAVGSKATLQTAITTAQATVTNALTTSQTDIDAAVTTLNAAIAAFNAGLVS